VNDEVLPTFNEFYGVLLNVKTSRISQECD